MAALVVAYALSPIDLVPDLIPVLGLIDDLALLPLGILLAKRLIPLALMAELRDKARGAALARSRWGAVMVFVAWVVLALAGVATWRKTAIARTAAPPRHGRS